MASDRLEVSSLEKVRKKVPAHLIQEQGNVHEHAALWGILMEEGRKKGVNVCTQLQSDAVMQRLGEAVKLLTQVSWQNVSRTEASVRTSITSHRLLGLT